MNRKKIPCIVLVYKEVDIVKKSLDFFASLSKYIDVIVIENPSNNTDEIRNHVFSLAKNGKIKKYYLFESNVTNNAFDIVLENELTSWSKSKYLIVSDGDVVVDNPKAWLKETLRTLRYKNVFCVGAGLKLDNLPLKTFPDALSWIPPLINDSPFHEGRTGCQLLTLRSKDMLKFLKWKEENGRFFTDGDMNNFCYKIIEKKWARTSQNLAYHLTWDLYANLDNEYTKLKTSKSFKETWYHKNTSDYEVINF